MRKILFGRLFRVRMPKSLGVAARDKSGSTAVEFAILSLPFMMLIFSIMEVGWFYFVNATVDSATVSAARILRTGTVQQFSGDADDQEQYFKDNLCRIIGPLGECSDIVTYEVKNYSSLTEAANDTATMVCPDDEQQDIDGIDFSPGGEDRYVRVRLCMRYATINPAIGVNLSETDGKRNLLAVHFVKVEPYESNNG